MGFYLHVDFAEGLGKLGEGLVAGCLEHAGPRFLREDVGNVLVFGEEDTFDTGGVSTDAASSLAVNLVWCLFLRCLYRCRGKVLEAGSQVRAAEVGEDSEWRGVSRGL